MKAFFHVHLISDSTGGTLSTVMRAACGQFENVSPIDHNYFLVRSIERMDKVIATISDLPGLVFYTISESKLRRRLEESCVGMGYPYLPVIDRAVSFVGSYLGMESDYRVAGQHTMNEEYFRRIEAINYVLAHDDGQGAQSLNEADVILVGVSRTSKTPTCVYLGNRGIKAANVPLVPGIAFSFRKEESAKRPLIVGLKISLGRLMQIRRQRLLVIGDRDDTNYVDEKIVGDEIREANRLFVRERWPIIDITRRSVEETAAAVLNLLENTHP